MFAKLKSGPAFHRDLLEPIAFHTEGRVLPPSPSVAVFPSARVETLPLTVDWFKRQVHHLKKYLGIPGLYCFSCACCLRIRRGV